MSEVTLSYYLIYYFLKTLEERGDSDLVEILARRVNWWPWKCMYIFGISNIKVKNLDSLYKMIAVN